MIGVRALRTSEWDAFKSFRLAALQAAPEAFATSYEEAIQRSPSEWQSIVHGPDNQVFGLFDGDRLIGIAGVFASSTDRTASFVMLFIMPAYRRRGLSRLLYEARLQWVRDRTDCDRVVVAIRASNEASRRACRHVGFVETGRGSRHWPDGVIKDELHYEMKLDR